ncbi:PH domain-containing protein [Microbacterium sp. STN6]|uniref:PH domain-containing protein n=1 Tax=Microbacterium sp. STN6 TaxID=2995588 RepID=UPI0022608E61|nr:PH domain-containing protein [Microbacterium sp. STN6]MCX7523065.1 PH domain-containing protein [Microbacterium sp. STN6]
MTDAPAVARMADGEWHRLHPLTPLLRGGIGLVAVLGIVLANLRERLVDMFLSVFGVDESQQGGNDYAGDPIDQIYQHGLVGWALLALAVLLVLAIALFYLAWRMHSFRIGDDAVEVRSGVINRRHRKARLDRIQGVNVSRPLFPRIFGTAKLEVSVAGQDANVELAYLGSQLADGLRRDILLRASGAAAAASGQSLQPAAPGQSLQPAAPGQSQQPAAPGQSLQPAGPASAQNRASELITRRLNEFVRPELDPDAAPPHSVVSIPPARLIGSIVISEFTVFLLIAVGLVVAGASTGRYWLLVAVLPGVIGSASFYLRRFTRSINYSIAGTPDGVRVGFGMLSTSNETLPPGRIHALEVMQPLLWRPFGWWQIRIDTAGKSKQKGAAGQPNTTMLPVGNADDVARVLALALSAFATEQNRLLIQAGMTARADAPAPGAGPLFSAAPRSAAVLRPFSWRRTGYRIADGIVLLRTGAVWRRLVIVPLARLQSVEVRQGPLRRSLHLAQARLHTVYGPVATSLPVIADSDAFPFFTAVADGAIDAAESDRSHRWNTPA